MRLIDADAIEYEHIKGEFRVSEETINGMPTVCNIDAIRAEIEQYKCIDYVDDKLTVDEVLQIIDKYTDRKESE